MPEHLFDLEAYSLLSQIQLILSCSLIRSGCCLLPQMAAALHHALPFHNIFDFRGLTEWFWLLCYVMNEENFLAGLRSTETLSGGCKCQKTQSNSERLASSPYGELFLTRWKWSLLRMILPLFSSHWKGGWKLKQCESLTVVGPVTTSQFNSASWWNGNSMRHNYKENTEK